MNLYLYPVLSTRTGLVRLPALANILTSEYLLDISGRGAPAEVSSALLQQPRLTMSLLNRMVQHPCGEIPLFNCSCGLFCPSPMYANRSLCLSLGGPIHSRLLLAFEVASLQRWTGDWGSFGVGRGLDIWEFMWLEGVYAEALLIDIRDPACASTSL